MLGNPWIWILWALGRHGDAFDATGQRNVGSFV